MGDGLEGRIKRMSEKNEFKDLVILTNREMMEFASAVNEKLIKLIGDQNVYRGKVYVVDHAKFANQEDDVQIPINIRSKRVVYIHGGDLKPNDYFVLLLLVDDAMWRSSPAEIYNVLPYIPYTRKDRKDRPRVPITASLFARVLQASSNMPIKIITSDLHSGQIQGFYDCPVENLYSEKDLAEFVKANLPAGVLENFVVVAPDWGASKRAEAFSKLLSNGEEKEIVLLGKRRVGRNKAEVAYVQGEVNRKHAIVIDDLIDTGGTLVKGAEALIKEGALGVYAVGVHAILSPKDGTTAEEKLLKVYKEIIVTDTIPRKYSDKRVRVATLTGLYAEVLCREIKGASISSLFPDTTR